jgi:hypothetical protein
VKRILDEECSLGEKLMLVEVLGNAASCLANEKDMPVPEYREQADGFFGSPFEAPMVILGTLKRKLTQTKTPPKGFVNHFHSAAELFINPFFFIFKNPFVLSQPLLLAKGLFSLSLMLDAAANHLHIERLSRDALEVWRRLKFVHPESPEVALNFAFLLSKLKRISKPDREEARIWL